MSSPCCPGWISGPAPVIVLVAAAVVAGALSGGFTDLSVYRFGGHAVLNGLPLYESRDPVTGLRFTYPPFAAVALAPLALLPVGAAAALWTGASVGAIAAVVSMSRHALGGAAPGWLVALITCGALALEPVWQNLAFGQVNLFVMLAVVVGLLGRQRRWSGLLVGLVAGLKLTPLVFVVLLVLVGRRAMAGRAVLAFAGTVLVGFAVTPVSASSYWADRLIDAGRVGPAGLAHNQSVYGALTRLLDGPPSMLLWLVVAGPLSLAALLVGVAWWRRGDHLFGTCLAAIAMLMASPVSWTHHWVWALPIAMVLWHRSRWAAVVWTAVFVTRPVVWPPWGQGREFAWTPLEQVAGNAYLIAGLTLVCWAGVGLRTGGELTR